MRPVSPLFHLTYLTCSEAIEEDPDLWHSDETEDDFRNTAPQNTDNIDTGNTDQESTSSSANNSPIRILPIFVCLVLK